MRADLLGVVEAAQQLGPDDAWLREVTEAAGPLLDGGFGVVGHFVDVSDVHRLKMGAMHTYGGNTELARTLAEVNETISPEMVDRTFRAAKPFTTVSECVGIARWREVMAGRTPRGVRDFSCVVSLDANGVGFAMGAPLGRVRRHPAAAQQAWARVAAHMVAMQRLRHVLGGGATDDDGEAVLSPGGNVENAVGVARGRDARTALRGAVLSREKARGKLRRQAPVDALQLWQAMVAGRWTIIDRFESDGRRFVVAHENRSVASGPRALSRREREVAALASLGHSNKLIAYELGLAVGSISGTLQIALRKLGLPSRVELVRLLRAPWRGTGG